MSNQITKIASTDDKEDLDDPGHRRRPEQRRSRARVDRILAVATKLIVLDGIDAITMSSLADEAGVSLPSIYRYFPSKRSILSALLERHIDAIRETTFGHLENVTTKAEAKDAARETMRGYWQYVRNNPAYAAIWSAGFADPEFAHVLIKAGRRNAEIFVDRIGHVLDEPSGSELMMFMVSYLAATTARIALVLDDPVESEELIEAFVERVLPAMLHLDH